MTEAVPPPLPLLDLAALTAQVDLPVLYADAHLIVVDKPARLNTIPGNALVKEEEDSEAAPPATAGGHKRKRTHQELWMDMLTEDPVALRHSLEASHHAHLAPHLAALMEHKSSVPRKRQVFMDWGVRTLKAPATDVEGLYEVLKAAFEAKEGNRQDSVQTRLLRAFKEIKTVHRLDCETSGVCVLARTVEAARHLSTQFREKQVGKRYVALVDGTPLAPHACGKINLPMRPDKETRPKQAMDPVGGKDCRTLFQTVAVDPRQKRTRVHLTPFTGRTHQLRVHMAALGYPIVGDSLYSVADKWPDMTPFVKEAAGSCTEEEDAVAAVGEPEETTLDTGGDRLYLHAEVLSFFHPITGERLRFVAEAPF